MANPKKILVAYDGSPHSKAALDWAMMLSVNNGAEVEVIKVFEPIAQSNLSNYVINTDLVEQYAEMEKADRQMMEDVKIFCKEACNAKVHVDVLEGNVASTLLDYARENGFELIVVGTKGHGMLVEMLLGSVTNSLVSLSKTPILVVNDQKAPAKLQKILVAYDGSDFAKAALDLAIDVARSAAAKLLAVKVTDPLDLMIVYDMAESGAATKLASKLTEIEEAEKHLLAGAKSAAAAKGMEIDTELLSGGSIADLLIQSAKENKADMIVAGTLGHGPFGELLMGSVTRKLVSLSKIPVLVAKK